MILCYGSAPWLGNVKDGRNEKQIENTSGREYSSTELP